MKGLKVAFVSFYLGEYCVRLASGIAEDSDTSVRLFLPKKEAEPYLRLLNSPVGLQLFDMPRMRHPFKHVQMLASLVRQIRSFNPDVIHLQFVHLSFNLFALPFLKNYPLVLTVHDALIHPGDADSAKTPQWVYDRACHQARERIVHAPQVKELLLQRMGIPSDTIHVIPHVLMGEDSALVEEEPLSEVPEVLFFGRIWEYKGLEYLIRAEPLITSIVPEAKIVIAGRGEDFGRYRRMMVHPDKFVIHNEYVSDAKRATLFRRASVVVLPYIEASQSGVIPVAYSFCKPVVATTVGGLPEMVEHGRTGYLVPPRDENALAKAIVGLLRDKALQRQLGENGRRKVNAECSPEAVGRMTRRVYGEAVNESRLSSIPTAMTS